MKSIILRKAFFVGGWLATLFLLFILILRQQGMNG